MRRSFASLAFIAFALSAARAGEDGFTALFNGKDLEGWHIMNNGQFSVKDKVIHLNKGSGWLRSDKEYKDFELRMEFRFVSKGADSGIFVRASKDGKNWPAKAYQVQTMDNNSIGEVFGAKSKRDQEKLKKAMKKTGEWQTYVITVKDGNCDVVLNDEHITVATGLEPRAGYIGLQGEGGILEFKNIRVKELK
jgi:hypothetical protein